MVLKVGFLTVKVEFSFFLMISFALLFGADKLLYVLLFSSLHELGHIIAFRIFSKESCVLTVSYYGIGMKYKAVLSNFQESAFLLSGCIINLIFAVLNLHRDINLSLFVLNILPIYPLDGGRLFKLIFGIHLNSFKCFSVLFLLSLIIYSVYTKNITLIIICVYLTLFSINEELR